MPLVWETIVARAKENKARIAMGVGSEYVEKTVACAEEACGKRLRGRDARQQRAPPHEAARDHFS